MTEKRRTVFNEDDFGDVSEKADVASPPMPKTPQGGQLPPVGRSDPVVVGQAPTMPAMPSGAPPPGTYVQQTYVVPQKTNGMAIASLVLGILWLYWLGSLLALIFGIIGKNQIDRSGAAEGGRGLAVAGIVLGIVGLGIFVLLLIIGASIVGTA
jgi:uncharacterized protein DUF4190